MTNRTAPHRLAPALMAVLIIGAACGSDTDAGTDAGTGIDADPGAEGIGDSFYPLLGNGGYDVIHYEIELDVEPATNTIEAVTTLRAAATQDLPAFNLDLWGLTVHAVSVDGVDAEFSRAGSELTVRPASSLPEEAEFSVTVSYSGSPELIDDPGLPFLDVGWQSRNEVIFTVGEPSGSMTWFPGNHHPKDKATFNFRITVPEPMTAAANGLLVDEVTVDGRTTATWQMNDPMTTYLAAIYVGDFERLEYDRSDGPLIRDYVPRDALPTVKDALSITPDVIRFYEQLLGPYPFEAYGTIVLPFETGFALENQTLSVHGSDVLDPHVIAHEIMHQWLGNSVTLEDWSDIWLNEGFAFYLPYLYLAEDYEVDLQSTMAQLHGMLAANGGTPPKGIAIHEMFDEWAVYVRGGLTLHALRGHVGDAVFSEILRTHYERAAGGATNTAAFVEIVRELAGRDAVKLIESWLFDAEVPETL